MFMYRMLQGRMAAAKTLASANRKRLKGAAAHLRSSMGHRFQLPDHDRHALAAPTVSTVPSMPPRDTSASTRQLPTQQPDVECFIAHKSSPCCHICLCWCCSPHGPATPSQLPAAPCTPSSTNRVLVLHRHRMRCSSSCLRHRRQRPGPNSTLRRVSHPAPKHTHTLLSLH